MEEDLRCHVVGRATHGRHRVLLRVIFTQTKINHFNASEVVLAIEHKILGFYISVRNLLGMEVFEGGKELLHDEGGYILREMPLLNDVVEQFSSLAISTRV